jgi:methionyl-tRNA formyltransferase
MKIIFAGTPEFAAPALEALIDASHDIIGVYTQPDRPSGRGRHCHPSAVKTLAMKYHIPIFQPKTLRDLQVQQALMNLQADTMIVAAYGLILPKVILESFPYGCINIHASLLPRFRGAAPIHRAILAGDNETGITIMQMAEGLDTGDILSKTAYIIKSDDNLKTLHDTLAQMGAMCLIKVLDNIKNVKPEIQDKTLATYAAKISKSEANLDWQQSAEYLHRAIRAFYPAYTYINNQLIKIWEAEVCRNAQYRISTAGTIVQIHSDSIDVVAGDGILRLKKLQLAGGKVLPVRDMLNSRANLLNTGNCFHAEHK